MDNQPQPPYETPYIPYVPPTPPKKERKGLKRAGVVLLFLLLAGAVGFDVYAWMQNKTLQDELQAAKSKTQTAQNKDTQPSDNPSGDTTAVITETLPNGKTMSYPDTEANRNILWWSASPDVNEGRDMIALSHKGFQQFLATVDSEVIASVCGTDDALKAQKYNIILGNFNTTTKELGDSEIVSCISQLTLEENPNTESRSAAQAVLDKADADVKQFVESVTIKE